MKWLNIFFTFMFIGFAALQYNDPDPYIWMPIYLLPAFLCWQASKGKYQFSLYLLCIGICVMYAIYLFFDKNGVLSWAKDHASESLVNSMKAEKPWIEESREFLGLLIIVVVVVINYIIGRKQLRVVSNP